MIKADQIKAHHAERILEGLYSRDEQGVCHIEGEKTEWWSDGNLVWFYEPGKDSEDTLKRFTTDRTVYEDD